MIRGYSYGRRYRYYGYCCRRGIGAAAGVVYGYCCGSGTGAMERGPLERGVGALLYEEELNTKLVSYHEICECAANFH